jgi:hypothetical protein
MPRKRTDAEFDGGLTASRRRSKQDFAEPRAQQDPAPDMDEARGRMKSRVMGRSPRETDDLI